MKLYEGQLGFLTTKKAAEWRAGLWKHTYTNTEPLEPIKHYLSGNYVFFIKFTGLPVQIPWGKVPEGYKGCLNRRTKVWKTPAKLLCVKSRGDLRWLRS
jgi:hypothetical protein